MTYAIILIIILALVGYIVHWWNLPATLAARTEATQARAKAADERREDQTAKLAARRAEQEKRRQERQDNRKKPR